MGTVKVTMGVGDPQGRQFEDIEVTLDSGSIYTAVPRELLQRLGVPVERSFPSETADGRTVPVDVGRTTIRLGGTGVLHAGHIRRGGRAQPAERGQSGRSRPDRRPPAGRLIPANLLRLNLRL